MEAVKRGLLLVMILFSSGCTESLVAPKADTSPPALFEELWQEFNLRYATFAERHVNWDSLHALYSPLVTANMPDTHLLKIFDSLLAPLRDGHVSIPDYRFVHTDSTYQFNFSSVSTDYLGETANETADGTLRFGRIHDSIAYVNVVTFYVSDPAAWGKEIDSVLRSFSDATALIIDLRANGGGYSNDANTLESRFIPNGTIIGYEQSRIDHIRTDLSSPVPIFISSSHAPIWTKPIILLTDRVTMSAAEWFTMAMRLLPNVTMIGDTTQGAFSPRLDRELSNGWPYSMSYIRMTDAKHICHEGIGLIPDIEVYVHENQRVGPYDTVIYRALQFLSK